MANMYLRQVAKLTIDHVPRTDSTGGSLNSCLQSSQVMFKFSVGETYRALGPRSSCPYQDETDDYDGDHIDNSLILVKERPRPTVEREYGVSTGLFLSTSRIHYSLRDPIFDVLSAAVDRLKIETTYEFVCKEMLGWINSNLDSLKRNLIDQVHVKVDVLTREIIEDIDAYNDVYDEDEGSFIPAGVHRAISYNEAGDGVKDAGEYYDVSDCIYDSDVDGHDVGDQYYRVEEANINRALVSDAELQRQWFEMEQEEEERIASDSQNAAALQRQIEMELENEVLDQQDVGHVLVTYYEEEIVEIDYDFEFEHYDGDPAADQDMMEEDVVRDEEESLFRNCLIESALTRITENDDHDMEQQQQVDAKDKYCCSICMNDEQQNAVQLQCSHAFHEPCIVRWLQQKTSCPLCRFQVIQDKSLQETLSSAAGGSAR